MSSAAMSRQPQAAIIHEIPPFGKEKITRYLNHAAALLIVFGVAFAGAFMAMQIHEPDGSDGRLALLSESDGLQTCDVEPMTVDEVMAIVRNPYRYSLTSSADPASIPPQAMELIEQEYAEAWSFRIDADLLDSRSLYGTESDFNQAVSRMNEWLECLETGTVGHVFKFTDPFEIQRLVLSDHPVFRDQDAIRTGVTALLEMPAAEFVRALSTLPKHDDYTIQANASKDDPKLLGEDQATRYNASLIIQIGIRVTDEGGNIIYENTANGIRTSDSEVAQRGPFTVLMAKSAYNGEWYVLAMLPVRM